MLTQLPLGNNFHGAEGEEYCLIAGTERRPSGDGFAWLEEPQDG